MRKPVWLTSALLVSVALVQGLPTSVVSANATAVTLSPASQTVVIGQALSTVVATPTGSTVSRLSNAYNVRTIAGPSAQGVSPQTVTTNELLGIQGVTQVANGDFYVMMKSITHIAPSQTSKLARVSRSTGAVTALTGTLSGNISISNLQSDSSGNLYVAIGNDVVQISVSGNTFTETGAKVSLASLRNFQVTDAGRVYLLNNTGSIFSEVMPGSATTANAVAYPATNPITFSPGSHGIPHGLYVDETVAGDPSNSRIFHLSDNMGVVTMATVTNNVGSATGTVSANNNLGNYQYSGTPVMDDNGNLYYQTQNAIRRLDTNGLTVGGAGRNSVLQAGSFFTIAVTAAESYRNTAAIAGYVDGPVGTNRIYVGSPIAPNSNPPAIDGVIYVTGGALALDIKGSNPTGELIIADTGNAALRAMNRVGWSVSPALHAGLTLNNNGSISGTPTGTIGLTPGNNSRTYTVTYTNADGSTVSSTTSITFEVPPTSFNYSYATTWNGNPGWLPIDTGGLAWGSSGQGVFSLNASIPLACPMTVGANFANPPNSACGGSTLITNAGLGLPVATTFSISPSLPAGVTFNTSNGGISGTAQAYSDVRTYTITATNVHGSATTTMPFGVPSPKTITFDANGGSGSMAPQSDVTTASINSPTFTPPSGKVFVKWNTAANGSGFSYLQWDQYSFTSDVTLYAQWANSYTLDLLTNGGVATQTTVNNGFASSVGQAVTFPQQTNLAGGTSITPILDDPSDQFAYGLQKPGFTQWAGWSTTPNGVNAEIFLPNDSFIIRSNMTLYALWDTAGTTYTFTYDLQGGTNAGGPLAPITGIASAARPTIDSGAGLSKPGFVFAGWNSRPDGSGADRSNNANPKIYANTTAYAIWAPSPSVTSSSPAALPLAGGTVTLSGLGLNSGSVSAISFGGNALNVTPLVNSGGTQMQVALPAMPAGTHQLSLTIAGVVVNVSVTYSSNPNSVSSPPTTSPVSSTPTTTVPSSPSTAPTSQIAPPFPVSVQGPMYNGVQTVVVGQVNVNVVNQPSGAVTFTIPSMAVGTYRTTLIYRSGKSQRGDDFVVSMRSVVARRLVTGFSGYSEMINPTVRGKLARVAPLLRSKSRVTCVGSTLSQRATSVDRKLARARAVRACNYLKASRPSIIVSLRINPASGISPAARHVLIEYVIS